MSKSKVSGSKRRHPERYRKQKIRTTANKEKAWKKHLDKHPNDLKAKEAIKKARSKSV